MDRKPPNPNPRPARPAGPRRAAILAPLVLRLRSEIRKVRRRPDDRRAVHDARVAGRRLLAAGDLWLAPSPGWGRARRRLERTIERIGRVRNLDVVLRILERRRGAGPERLASLLKVRRRRERGRLGAWLGGGRIGRVEGRIGKAVGEARRPGRKDPGPADLRRGLRGLAALGRVRDLFADVERAHEIRRRVRLLRYGFEALPGDFSEGDLRRAAARLVRLQDLAGAWHDRYVLLRWAGRAEGSGVDRGDLASLRAATDLEMRSLAERFAAAWPGLRVVEGLVAERGRAGN